MGVGLERRGEVILIFKLLKALQACVIQVMRKSLPVYFLVFFLYPFHLLQCITSQMALMFLPSF